MQAVKRTAGQKMELRAADSYPVVLDSNLQTLRKRCRAASEAQQHKRQAQEALQKCPPIMNIGFKGWIRPERTGTPSVTYQLSRSRP